MTATPTLTLKTATPTPTLKAVNTYDSDITPRQLHL